MNGKEWYQQQLQTPEWKSKRKEIYTRDGYACIDCGNRGVTLHCHHEHYVQGMKPWEYPPYALVTVCEVCHDNRHKAFINVFGSHEEAEMWVLFAEAERAFLEFELQERDRRLKELSKLDSVWDHEGQYFGVVDNDGRSRFFDADGNPL
jgi:hypothetical protein